MIFFPSGEHELRFVHPKKHTGNLLMFILFPIVAFIAETFFWVKIQNRIASLSSVSVYAGKYFQAETSFNFSLITLTLFDKQPARQTSL